MPVMVRLDRLVLKLSSVRPWWREPVMESLVSATLPLALLRFTPSSVAVFPAASEMLQRLIVTLLTVVPFTPLKPLLLMFM